MINKIIKNKNDRVSKAALALVCGGPLNWFNCSCAFNHWQQIFWHQLVLASHLRFMYPCQYSLLSVQLEKEVWNLVFVFGIFLGGAIAINLMSNPHPVEVNPKLAAELAGYGITNFNSLVPEDIINWQSLFTLKGFLIMVTGGFLVGFGTRYAGGCTSGHAIMGLSNLQLPSLIATVSFMIGGFIMANLILPLILSL